MRVWTATCGDGAGRRDCKCRRQRDSLWPETAVKNRLQGMGGLRISRKTSQGARNVVKLRKQP